MQTIYKCRKADGRLRSFYILGQNKYWTLHCVGYWDYGRNPLEVMRKFRKRLAFVTNDVYPKET